MLPGPEEGREVHSEGEHGAERADHQRDQPGHRGEPRETSSRQGCRGNGKKGKGHTLDAQASSSFQKRRSEKCCNS